jgi:EpsI family protein
MNRSYSIVAIFIGLFMVSSAVMAVVLKPDERMAENLPPLSLEEAIPEQFGDWHIDPSIVPVDPSPDVEARLDEIYSQTLSRTYANSQGQRIMLSIAYGADQSGDGNQVHRPEFCYTAQGFQLLSSEIGRLITDYGSLPVRRLLAKQGARNEPITYWITIGDKATLPGFKRKINQLAYGLSGTVPDGMLVRVSSISSNTEAAYELHAEFVRDMLASMDPQSRIRTAGRFGA